jgi:hypothetical protein
MNAIVKTYIILGALAVAVLYWFTRKGNAANIGIAVSQAAVDLTAGAVQGAATIVGVPLTNDEKCQLALKNRDSLDVSLYCDAATFFKYEKDMIFGSDVTQIAPGTDNTPPLQ